MEELRNTYRFIYNIILKPVTSDLDERKIRAFETQFVGSRNKPTRYRMGPTVGFVNDGDKSSDSKKTVSVFKNRRRW